MNQELHRQAMDLVDEARLLELRESHEAAREKYRAAAPLEERCADAVGDDEPRSRGILRVSAVSVWMQTGEFDRAEAVARRYLTEPLLPGFYREIYELLGQIEQRRAEARTIAAEPDESADDVTAALRKVEEDLDAGKVRLWAIKSAA